MGVTWQEKLKACQALGNISLHMRDVGDWYVNHEGVSRKEGYFLIGGCVRDAKTPEEAVNQHWDWLINLPSQDIYLVIENYKGRHAVRWNGFMWEEVHEEAQ